MIDARRCFIDSNIWIYAVTKSEDVPPDFRNEAARTLIKQTHPCLSIQVINEISVNLIRKFKFTEFAIQNLIRSFYQKYPICPIDEAILLEASAVRQHYKLSFWDSVIVSTAVHSQCTILYTEDMGHGLLINDVLTIVGSSGFRVISSANT
jgi:predicted nucleic acid-binding protein